MLALCAEEEMARRRFFDYCHLKAPDFYMPGRAFIVELCDAFQDFIESDEEDMISTCHHGTANHEPQAVSLNGFLEKTKTLKS